MNHVVEFLAMDGHGLYVWGSLGMCAAVLVAEMALLRLRRRLLERAMQDEIDDGVGVSAPDPSRLHGGRA
ncbi:MAG: heme exporter protein CcmD [Comamonadaceae bacterium]|jgi:heme exporter protein D|nr:heme exporter protein CcmD [Comamonadaceae bacterium]